MFCARLFICALWSPAGKGLTSWLSLVVSSVSLSLSHWYPGSGVVLDCIDSWSLHHYLLSQYWMKMFTRLFHLWKPSIYKSKQVADKDLWAVGQRDEGMDITIAWQYAVCITKESSHKGTCMVLIRHYSMLGQAWCFSEIKLSARCGCWSPISGQ